MVIYLLINAILWNRFFILAPLVDARIVAYLWKFLTAKEKTLTSFS
ncbi:MAG: hypothetical protein RSB84_02515 [Erysipelotrichaceae bacterium]